MNTPTKLRTIRENETTTEQAEVHLPANVLCKIPDACEDEGACWLLWLSFCDGAFVVVLYTEISGAPHSNLSGHTKVTVTRGIFPPYQFCPFLC